MTETNSTRVLHVDDEPDFADMTATFLERENRGLSVKTATSAAKGVDKIESGKFDCVVSDYQMPEQNGIEFLRTVRQSHPDLPFILFTGKGSEEVAGDAISAGASDYLQKQPGSEQFKLLANRIQNLAAKYTAEEQATQAKNRLRELSEVTTDILWMFTADWETLLYINSAYEDIWGRSIEALEADAGDFLDGIHPDDRERVRAAMNRISNGHSVDIEYRVNSSEDYGRWVWVLGEPIFNDVGRVVRTAGFARDITDRKDRN